MLPITEGHIRERRAGALSEDVLFRRYRPLRRLLDPSDEQFLADNGHSKRIAQLRCTRRKIYWRMVTSLRRDLKNLRTSLGASRALAGTWNTDEALKADWAFAKAIATLRLAGAMHMLQLPGAHQVVTDCCERLTAELRGFGVILAPAVPIRAM